jgi:hypothetical protein
VHRVLLAVLVVAAGVLSFPQPRTQGSSYQVGDVARERVTAPFDFHIRKDEAELRRERDVAARAIPPVLRRDPRIWVDAQGRYASFAEGAASIMVRTGPGAERQALLRQLGVPLTAEEAPDGL